MRTLDEIKEIYGLTDEELEYAIEKAKGIILGYAMELRAIKVLESMNFRNIRYVDLPTHDLEAEKCGNRYYIEVKASKKSPTREYSAHKLAMIAMLDGTHLTLVMNPSPHLFETEDILSEPKRILYRFFKYAYKGETESLKSLISDEKYKVILSNYQRVIKYYMGKYNVSLDILKSLF
ncbi:MAG: hypothetical protein RXQ80_01785 [Sulfolobaceae archaeon]|nr:hypothetical protein [Stygiolobus sp.]MDT7875223.1 hypothetical protein [Sulfolobaceae archaeon]